MFKLIALSEFANPIVLLDELDTANSSGNHYRPADAPHAVLEPSTAAQLRHKRIDLTFDASYTVFVATGNRLSTISTNLASIADPAMPQAVEHELIGLRRVDNISD